jgi:carotenoid isomerooxygenase
VSIVSHTSHPHVMDDGTVYNLGMRVTRKGPAYIIVKFSPNNFVKSKFHSLLIFEI